MKKKTNISDKTLNLITKKQLKPIPKWEFVVKNWSLWLGLIFCLLLLVLGFGLSWFGIIDNIIVPYLWISIAVAFFLLSFFIFRKTKRAYRFDNKIIVAIIILLGLILGGILFKTGLANQIDRGLESRSAHYRQIVPMKQKAWNNPRSGYLSGTIHRFNSVNNFDLIDFSQKIWIITGKNPQIRGRVILKVGEEIKLIGTQIDKNHFQAQEIRPWSGMDQNILKENN